MLIYPKLWWSSLEEDDYYAKLFDARLSSLRAEHSSRLLFGGFAAPESLFLVLQPQPAKHSVHLKKHLTLRGSTLHDVALC